MPPDIFDEIQIVHKEVADLKVKSLMEQKVMIADVETDIDKES